MRWVPIAEEDAVSEMWLVWPKHHEQSPAARNFRIHLLNVSGEGNFSEKAQKCAVNHMPK